MAQAAADWLHARLRLSTAVVMAGSPLAVYAAGAPAERFDGSSARWAMEHGRPLGRGTDDWRDLPLWVGPFARREATGAVMLLLGARDQPARDEVAHWAALARQVGLSIGREQAATEARAARDSAHAEAARNTLLASLSHDLRTPLAGILGSASTLRAQGESLSPAQRDRLLANLEDEARDLAWMADNVLQLARLSQPQTGLRKQWESVEEVLGAAVTRMRRRWPGARIELRSSADLPPVSGEAGLLAQLVANLVDNAVRHGGGEPHVIVRAGHSRGGVFIAVRDHGAGLPQGEDPQALFERPPRGGNAGGAGLGLALCRLIAEAHGGSITVRRCEPGAEVRVDLPASQPEPAHAS
jgi:two-component system sensor histidine kinase KdpD